MTTHDFNDWIGNSEKANDRITCNLVKRVAATLNECSPGPGDPLPLLWHWAFFQEPIGESGLGVDGHPVQGSFLPPIKNLNRMWAGSRIDFINPLEIEVEASRQSTILSVTEKSGRSGPLLFLTVQHKYLQNGQISIIEEQDIVYRPASPPKLGNSEKIPLGEWKTIVQPSEVLLFRYSAATFNAHRIHYDLPYSSYAEGYTGLVVQGPLIATLNLMAFQKANPNVCVKRFSFRGIRPLMMPDSFEVGGRFLSSNTAQLWAASERGTAQAAEVEFTREKV